MKAKLEMRMNDSAFEQNPGAEAARILRELAARVEQDNGDVKPGFIYTIRDANGNRVGIFEIHD